MSSPSAPESDLPSPPLANARPVEHLTTEGFWSDAWKRHIDRYLAAPPRAGYWIRSHFPDATSVLEIAGGSCRDSYHLATCGVRAVGSDFEPQTVAYVAERLKHDRFTVAREDGFAMSWPDRNFDLSFSNGFWVCFRENADVLRLLREQARVTKRYVVALVHNGENARLRRVFARRAEEDPLYDIRFYSIPDLKAIVDQSGLALRSVAFRKFGGPIDPFAKRSLKGVWNPLAGLAPRCLPRAYSLLPWSRVERIALILELA